MGSRATGSSHSEQAVGAGRARSIAFVLPQFHPIPENNAWWGPGFTEWTNVATARPVFDGHQQPTVPADLGYYDLRLAETRAAQAALARRYGVDAFCYYHYWFEGRRLLETPFEAIRASRQPDFPFALCWANEDWRSKWNGRTGEMLMKQTYSEQDDEAHIAYLIECFRDPRYVRVDGKPLFLVYRAAALPDPRRTAALWRRRAREADVGEIMLVRVESGFAGESGDPAAIGFDAAVEFQPDWGRLPAPDPTLSPHAVIDYGEAVDAMLAKPPVPYRRFPGVTPRWDNTPRRQRDATVLRGSTPELYGRWLAEVARRAVEADPDPLVFVNAWNEWAEGAHLEPCAEYGHSYLQEHASAIATVPSGTPVATRASLLANLKVFRDLERRASRAASVGEVEEALRSARAAADWASCNHTGLFASPVLEAMLDKMATELLPVPSGVTPRPDGMRRVLHVLTEGHAVSGQTRLVWRWMTHDDSSIHSVALTDQVHPPAALVEAAVGSGGSVTTLTAGSLLDRAAALREHASGFDLVVLHIHPHDVIAALAFAGRSCTASGPKTAFMNHADQVFWLGAAAADTLISAREVGDVVASSRRGIDPDRFSRLPLPLEVPPSTTSRSEARRLVGLPEDARVLLTISSPYKYSKSWPEPHSLVDLLLPVLRDRPDVVLVAVGPDGQAEEWLAAAEATSGRVRALGGHQDVELLRQAADVHVDSYPCGSPTSMLESALAGLPAISYTPDRQELAALLSDSPGLDNSAWCALDSVDDYKATLLDLIDRPEHAGETGSRLRESVAAAHCGDGWLSSLSNVYGRAASSRPGTVPVEVSEVPRPLDHALVRLHQAGGMARSLAGLLAHHGLDAATHSDQADDGVEPNEAPRLSIVMVVDGDPEATVDALQTIVDECAAVGRLEALIVDNASSDGTEEALRALASDVRSVRLGELTPPAEAWQIGANLATGELLLMMSNDIRLVPGCLPPLLKQLIDDDGKAVVAPVLDSGGAHAQTSGITTTRGICLLAVRRALLGGGPLSVVTVLESVVRSVQPARAEHPSACS